MKHKFKRKTMNKTEYFNKAVLLKLPSTRCDEVDKLTEALGMTRTAFLHQAIARNVKYINQVEIPFIRRQQQNYNRVQ
jgi:hypothetical protein